MSISIIPNPPSQLLISNYIIILVKYSLVRVSLLETLLDLVLIQGIVTSTGFTNATPQRKVLFIDRVTG